MMRTCSYDNREVSLGMNDGCASKDVLLSFNAACVVATVSVAAAAAAAVDDDVATE